MTLKPDCWEKVSNALNNAVASDFVFPGAVLTVGYQGKIVFEEAVGSRTLFPSPLPMHQDTVFDVASLTKVLVTTTLIAKLVQEKKITIEDSVEKFFPKIAAGSSLKIRHLLNHSSGYVPTLPFYEELREEKNSKILQTSKAKDFVVKKICELKPETVPGEKAVYSDLNFILLGDIIEQIYGESFEVVAEKEIFKPLGLSRTGFINLERSPKLRNLQGMEFAATLNCPWRKKVLEGEVHDDNTWAMGGVAGHAGLFSTTGEVFVMAQTLLDASRGANNFLNCDVLDLFWKRDVIVPESFWALGWDTPTTGQSSSGQFFSEKSVGHLAFTGCSLWIDPLKDLIVVLLSNRIHPELTNQQIRIFRPQIHDLVMQALELDK
jgi:CubicO group peptidase (beta-lactamase class C family)